MERAIKELSEKIAVLSSQLEKRGADCDFYKLQKELRDYKRLLKEAKIRQSDPLLYDLKENLVDEFNFEDRSVGYYRVIDLKEHFKHNDHEGVTVIEASKCNAIIECEGRMFKISEHVETYNGEVMDSHWGIEPYSVENN